MCALEADLASVDQTFGGTFKAPNLLNDKDGIATEIKLTMMKLLSPVTGEIEWRDRCFVLVFTSSRTRHFLLGR